MSEQKKKTNKQYKGKYKKLYDLHKNYQFLNETIASELKIASDHPGTTGSFREKMWMNFFRGMIPRKYSLSQNVKIIDSSGRLSKEIDIVVFDEQYMPYVFVYDDVKYIPIEAVVVVIECKSTSMDHDKLKKWSKSVDDLKPNPTGIARMNTGYVTGLTSPIQSRTRPIKILAATKQVADITEIENRASELIDSFDFVIMGKKGGNYYSFDVVLNHEDKSLEWWGKWLNTGQKPNNEDFGVQLQNIDIPKPKEENFNKLTYEKAQKKRVNELNKNYPQLKFEMSEDSKSIFMTNEIRQLKVEGNPLLTLNFQLNQLLMLINNPMLFPHFAYAHIFNKAIGAANPSTNPSDSKKQKSTQQSEQGGEES